MLADGFEQYAIGVWQEDSTNGPWKVTYNGYGKVETLLTNSSYGKVLQASPQASSNPDETHASLINSTESFGDLTFSVDAITVKQLRINSTPNPWEVAWLTWHHDITLDTYYYFVLKPNGWELGKVDYEYPEGQRYLATGTNHKLQLNRWHKYQVRQNGSLIQVSVNGLNVVSFEDVERPYLSGTVGLYTEDARVRFDNVLVEGIQNG